MKLSSTLVLACSLALSAPAWADPSIPDVPGDEVEMGEDDTGDAGEPEPLIDDGEPLPGDAEGIPGGAEENPDDPSKIAERIKPHSNKPEPPPPYPLEFNQRPLTLFAGMSEVTVELPLHFNGETPSGDAESLQGWGEVRARYGISEQIEAGLRYGFGGYHEDGFESGKTIAIVATYRLKEFVAVQLTVPMLLDPFAAGFTLGAPMKFTFGKLRFDLGHDFLTVAAKHFTPDVANPLATQQMVDINDVNGELSAGAIKVLGRVTYQKSPNLVLGGESGFVAEDFKGDKAEIPLWLLLTYSPSNKIDMGGRLGFFQLSEASKNIGLAVFAAVRI